MFIRFISRLRFICILVLLYQQNIGCIRSMSVIIHNDPCYLFDIINLKDIKLMCSQKTQTIHSLLRLTRGNKSNVIPSSVLNRIVNIITNKQRKVYHYEILNLYQYLSINMDENAFHRIDKLLFPLRSQQSTIELSLPLAYRRLYCLIKYQVPFVTWIDKLREQMYEHKLTSCDFKYLLNLGIFKHLRADENFLKLYQEILILLQQQINKFDNLTIVAISKFYIKSKINVPRTQNINLLLQRKIQQSVNFLAKGQLRFLYQSKNQFLKKKSAFHYYLKVNQFSIRKYGFFLLYLTVDYMWKKQLGQKLTNKEILQKLPGPIVKQKSIIIVERLFGNLSQPRPYIDQFFQFQQEVKGNQKKIRLKYPQRQYFPFLLNAFYYLQSNQVPSEQQINKIDQIISETQYIQRKPINICLYLFIKYSIILCRNLPQEQRQRQQKELIIQLSNLMKDSSPIQYQNLRNYRTLPTKMFSYIGGLQFSVYKLREFKIFFDKFLTISNQVYNQVASVLIPSYFMELTKIINTYMSQQINKSQNKTINQNSLSKDHQSTLFFGQSKRAYPSIIQKQEYKNIEIRVAKQPQINRKITVDYLVEVKDKQSKEQFKYLIQFGDLNVMPRKVKISQIPLRKYWKYNYLVNWCNLDFYLVAANSIDDYLQKQEFANLLEDKFKLTKNANNKS